MINGFVEFYEKVLTPIKKPANQGDVVGVLFGEILDETTASLYISGTRNVSAKRRRNTLQLLNKDVDELRSRISQLIEKTIGDEEIASVISYIKSISLTWRFKPKDKNNILNGNDALKLAQESISKFEPIFTKYRADLSELSAQEGRERREAIRKRLCTIVAYVFVAAVDVVDIKAPVDGIVDDNVDERSTQFDLPTDNQSASAEDFAREMSPVTIAQIPIATTDCTLRSTGIYVRPNFVSAARKDVFEALDEAFGRSQVVFLYGIGGIGKSELAKHWALDRIKTNTDPGLFDTVVFSQLNSERTNSNIMSLITDDNVFVISGNFRTRSEAHFSAGIEESQEDYFKRKLAKIKQITNERTLIILDNYDIDDLHLRELFNGNYLLLITTRNKQPEYAYPIIEVEEIGDIEHLKSIFFNNLDGKRSDISYDDPYIEKLFSLVSNHTLAIEIIAKSLISSRDTLQPLYERMSNPKQHSLIETMSGKIKRDSVRLSPFECIQTLFSLSKLETDSDFEYISQLLAFMAVMPTKGIELWLLNKWSDNDLIYARESLIEKSWLRLDNVNGIDTVSMHPLIREVIWHDLVPTVKKCHSLLFRMADTALGAWRREYSENLRITSAITSALNSFSTTIGEYICIFEPCISFLWQVGEFDNAINYGHLLYESCVEIYGENSPETGFAAKSLGGCYFNCRRLEDSVAWYKRGLDSMLASGISKSIDTALAHEKVARCYTWRFNQDFEKAKEHFKCAMSLYLEINDELEAGRQPLHVLHQLRTYTKANIQTTIAGLNMEMGRMYQIQGEYEIALELAKQSCDTNERYDPTNISTIAYTYLDQGICLYNIAVRSPGAQSSTANLHEALRCLTKAMEYNKQMRGELAIDMVDNHEILGDVYAALQMLPEAVDEYRRAIYTLENLLGANCERIALVRAKLQQFSC